LIYFNTFASGIEGKEHETAITEASKSVVEYSIERQFAFWRYLREFDIWGVAGIFIHEKPVSIVDRGFECRGKSARLYGRAKEYGTYC